MSHWSGWLYRLSLLFVTSLLLLALLQIGAVLVSPPPIVQAVPVAPTTNSLRLVVIAQSPTHPFWQQLTLGAQAEAQARHVSLEVMGPRQPAVTEQVRLMDMALASQVDGVIMQGVDDPAIALAAQKLKGRGVPVLLIGDGATFPHLAAVGSENRLAGQLVAQELIRRSGGQGTVGIVRGYSGPPERDERLQGFLEGVRLAPGIEVVAIAQSDLNQTLAGQRALEILGDHPNLTALWGMTQTEVAGITRALALQRRSPVLILGGDCSAPPSLVSGRVQEQPQEIGRLAVQMLESYLRRDERLPEVTRLPVTADCKEGAR